MVLYNSIVRINLTSFKFMDRTLLNEIIDLKKRIEKDLKD